MIFLFNFSCRYVNKYCRWTRKYWICSLCLTHNEVTESKRYAEVEGRNKCIELTKSWIEFKVFPENDLLARQNKTNKPVSEYPLFLALVDLTGDGDSMEIIKEGLKAVLEGE